MNDNVFFTGEFLIGIIVGLVSIVFFNFFHYYLNLELYILIFISLFSFMFNCYILFFFMNNRNILNKIFSLNVFGRTVSVMLSVLFEILFGFFTIIFGILSINFILINIGMGILIMGIVTNIFVINWYFQIRKRGNY